MKIKFLFFVLLVGIGLSECPEGTLCYPETGLPKINRLNPYHAATIQKSLENYDKRFFALIHETLYEQSTKPFANFIVNPNQPLTIICNESDSSLEQQCYCQINTPDEFQTKWKFHNGTNIESLDVIYSIKYAIKVGILDEAIFNSERTKINYAGNNQWDAWETYIDKNNNGKYDRGEKFNDDKGNVEIGLNFALGDKTLKAFLVKVSLIPAKIFKDYIDNKNIQYSNDTNIKEFEINPIGAGPFNLFKHSDMNKRQILKSFDSYMYSPYIKSMQVEYNSLRSDHTNDLKLNIVNLVIDIPYREDLKKDEKFEIKSYHNNSVNLLFVNHNNKYLSNLNFRKAIAFLINKEAIRKSAFKGRCKLIDSPVTLQSSRFNPHIQGYDLSKKKAIKIVKKLISKEDKFKFEGKGKKQKLFFKNSDNWEQVELRIAYNYNGVSEAERTALNNIRDALKSAGIKVSLKGVNSSNWESKQNNPKTWHLLYDRITIDEGQSLHSWYAKKGRFNKKSTKYYNPVVDQLIISENNNKLNPAKAIGNGKQLMRVLSDDVASIFLWSIDSYYAYNKEVFSPENNLYINYYDFFSSPHKWKLIK